MPYPARSIEERFWSKTDRRADSECWPWTAYRDKGGYGQIHEQVDGVWRGYRAHRFAYELLVGEIPDGLTIDHLCRNPSCVNPAHMEPVPIGVNTLRGTGFSAENARKIECKRGHPLSGCNLQIDAHGYRQCRLCNVIRRRKSSAQREAASVA